MTPYREQAKQLAASLEANDRLRYGVYAIVFLALAWAVLALSDANAGLQRDYRALAESYREFKSLGSLETWEARKEQQLELRERLSGKIWQAASESVTVAALQATVRRLAREAGLTDYAVRMGAPQIVNEDLQLYRIRVSVGGGFAGDDMLRFLARVEDFQPSLMVESLDIHVNRRGIAGRNTVGANVVAFYVKKNGVAGNG